MKIIFRVCLCGSTVRKKNFYLNKEMFLNFNVDSSAVAYCLIHSFIDSIHVSSFSFFALSPYHFLHSISFRFKILFYYANFRSFFLFFFHIKVSLVFSNFKRFTLAIKSNDCNFSIKIFPLYHSISFSSYQSSVSYPLLFSILNGIQEKKK